MATETTSRYRTKQLPMYAPDGTVSGFLTVPDKSDPAFQAEMQVHLDLLNAALDRAAEQLGITRDELVDRLSHD